MVRSAQDLRDYAHTGQQGGQQSALPTLLRFP